MEERRIRVMPGAEYPWARASIYAGDVRHWLACVQAWGNPIGAPRRQVANPQIGHGPPYEEPRPQTVKIGPPTTARGPRGIQNQRNVWIVLTGRDIVES
jgi:hypothetical protein